MKLFSDGIINGREIVYFMEMCEYHAIVKTDILGKLFDWDVCLKITLQRALGRVFERWKVRIF